MIHGGSGAMRPESVSAKQEELARAGLEAALDAGVADQLVIQYGGSVKAANASELMVKSDIDGGLIGGASLVAEEFVAICRAAAK